ncbi:MAG: hypothetical protein JWO32_2585 [Bacteroidetes bacterium]|nr:hypothetical protein [Bacteroidota bacterium]
MPYILDISTAVPEFTIEKEDLERFYSDVADTNDNGYFLKKLGFLNRKTMINRRHSCIPDYNGKNYELYTNGNYEPSVNHRLKLYKEKILPLASKAIDKLFNQTGLRPEDVTHLITVSCTGHFAPGMEFVIAEHYGISHVEKTAVNFLGCYAALKALKQAQYIASANPDACVLIVCAELCSLHFFPSFADEEILANLLFSDGAAATIVCGEKSKHLHNKIVFNIDEIGSAIIPGTKKLMTWDITTSAFRMFLSKQIVSSIRENIQPVLQKFLKNKSDEINHWAVHPGGVKIVEAVQQAMGLNRASLNYSYDVLKDYGNMSSPTILFILQKVFNEIKGDPSQLNKKIFSCAFGPGINVEMITMTSIKMEAKIHAVNTQDHTQTLSYAIQE